MPSLRSAALAPRARCPFVREDVLLPLRAASQAPRDLDQHVIPGHCGRPGSRVLRAPLEGEVSQVPGRAGKLLSRRASRWHAYGTVKKPGPTPGDVRFLVALVAVGGGVNTPERMELLHQELTDYNSEREVI